MYIKIKPHDALFFRDGKPFNKGEDTWANTTTMPNPSVLWGAIASLSYVNGNTLTDMETNLKLKKIYLYNEDNYQCYIPAPRDIFIASNKNICYGDYTTFDDTVVSSLDLPYFIKSTETGKFENTENYFIELTSFYCDYYQRFNTINLIPISRIIFPDHKIGITRNRMTHSSEDGKLYRIDSRQFKIGWSILIEIEYNDLSLTVEKGFLKLGGESKAAGYEVVKKDYYSIKRYKDRAVKINNENIPQYFKIVLTTPAVFKQKGWKPSFNKDFSLCGASVGKPLYIGGFDMKKKMPKPMYKAVPAGSVYLYKNDGNYTIKQINERINDHKPGEWSLDFDKGFGAYELLSFARG